MTLPADGDRSRYSVGGYLRLFKADGTPLGHSHDDCIAVLEVFWHDNALGGFGCGEHLIALLGKTAPD